MVRDLNERLLGIRRRMAAESFDLELKDGRFFR
jgi:hypothetical protein